jgi:uncharacterized protein (TIGR02147 family)
VETIDHYDNFRKFLKDYYEDSKLRSNTFSYRYFCKKAGIKSPSFYKEVVDGKRDLTPNMADAFAKALRLSASDRRYFKALVAFNQSSSVQEKQIHLEQMHSLRRRVRRNPVPLQHYTYFSRWYHPAIRELACIADWNNDYTLLAKMVRPPIQASQARESIELLTVMGFIRKNQSGRYEQTTPALGADSEIQMVALRNYNKTMAELAGNAIETVPRDEREIRSLTVGISKSSYDLLREEIQCFVERIVRIVDDDKVSDRVYNINIHLFPVSSMKQTGEKMNHETQI